MATRLDSEQRRVLDELLRAGQAIKDPRARRVYERAAVQTGLVESGLRNLNHGDADSLGWRQERASLYPNPTNVRASAQRFAQEFLQHYDPGEKSYQVAAQVQRPAAQYAGRYQDVAGQAAQLLRAYGSGGGGDVSGAAVSSRQPGAPDAGLMQAASLGGDMGPAQSIAGTVASLLNQQRPAGAASSLQAPAFAAGPAFAGATPQGGGGPAARADIGALIEATRTPGASVSAPQAQGVSLSDMAAALAPSGTAPQGSPRGGGVVPLGGSKNAGKGAFQVIGPNPDRLTKPLTSFMGTVAEIYGGKLVGLDGSTHSKYTVNGNVSEHHSGAATDVFTIGGLKYGDPGWERELIRAGQAALIAAGMPRAKALKQRGGLYNVGRSQVIFNVDGAANGGNHLDHLHASRRPKR